VRPQENRIAGVGAVYSIADEGVSLCRPSSFVFHVQHFRELSHVLVLADYGINQLLILRSHFFKTARSKSRLEPQDIE
jgi:hypothetical protein